MVYFNVRRAIGFFVIGLNFTVGNVGFVADDFQILVFQRTVFLIDVYLIGDLPGIPDTDVGIIAVYDDAVEVRE